MDEFIEHIDKLGVDHFLDQQIIAIPSMSSHLSSQRAVAETKTKGGLLIPETAQKSPLEATVVAAGPGARNATTGG